MEFLEKLKILKSQLKDLLEQAPMEEDCEDEENEMYADMENLLESIKEYERYLEV